MPDEPGFELPDSSRFALGKFVVESDVHDILAMNRQSLAPLSVSVTNAERVPFGGSPHVADSRHRLAGMAPHGARP